MISDHYEQMQVIKCELLSHTLYPNNVALYQTIGMQNAKFKQIWKATNTVKEAHAEVNLDLNSPASQTNKGLDLESLSPIHL